LTDNARVIGLYRRHARTWAAARAIRSGSRPIEAGWLDQFCGLLPHPRAVLDLGCGSGEPMARYLIEQGCDLTGLDAAPEMIAIAASRFPRQTWFVVDIRLLPLVRTFDGILAWDSFFHLCPDDQRRMFPLFRAHGTPGAALLFTSGPA
jgi:SAM-dependent methyltransferase